MTPNTAAGRSKGYGTRAPGLVAGAVVAPNGMPSSDGTSAYTPPLAIAEVPVGGPITSNA